MRDNCVHLADMGARADALRRVLGRAVRTEAWRTLAQRSALAGDGDVQRVADLTHPFVAESADALDERPDRHALD